MAPARTDFADVAKGCGNFFSARDALSRRPGNDAIARAALISRRVDMCDAAPQQPAIRGGRLAAAVRTHMNPKGERVDIMRIIGE
jgi:hypothetical protein